MSRFRAVGYQGRVHMIHVAEDLVRCGAGSLPALTDTGGPLARSVMREPASIQESNERQMTRQIGLPHAPWRWVKIAPCATVGAHGALLCHSLCF